MLLTPTQRLQRNLDDGSAIASGTYAVTQPLRMTGQDGAVVRTTGRRVTLVWDGASNESMFEVTDCANPSFRDLDARFPNPAMGFMQVWRAGHIYTHDGVTARPSTGLHLKDVRVFGLMKLLNGVSFLTVNGVDANNEHAAFERVDLYDFTNRGVLITHKQSKEHYFEHCRFGSASAAIGVESASGFNWSKGAFYGMIPFMLAGGGGDRVSIRDASAENCLRFLVQAHYASDPWQITVDGCTYRANAMAEDGEWIQLHNVGPLTVINCQVGGGKMARVPVIGIRGPGTPTLRISNNSFDAFGADTVCPVVCAPGAKVLVDWGLNTYTKADGAPERTLTVGEWLPPTLRLKQPVK